jgi:ABC-2 type transport system permease protein
MKKYIVVWKTLAFNALQEALINRGTNILFLFGKMLRTSFGLLFLYLIQENVSHFAHYTTDQMIVFYITYLLVDTLAQVFYRGVYLFSNEVRTGEFDFMLAKPINPLFRALTGKPDINDCIFLIPLLLLSIWMLLQLDIPITASAVFVYCMLLLNAFLIATALHIVVLVIGVLTTEVDGIIWMYRDLMRLGQFPVSIYMQPLRFALYIIVPVGLMITIPAEALLSLTPVSVSIATLFFGIGFFLGSLKLWQWSLTRYQSASS